MHRVWLIPDLQVPFHDVRAVANVAQCIADHKSDDDIVTTVGDEQDFQTISRWAVNTAKEWERSIAKDRDLTRQVLSDLQVQHTIRSNHTDRLYMKIMSGAPGFLGLPELELENFWGLEELGITHHRRAFPVAPGWVVLHGDESGVSQLAGRTSANLTAKVGMSVACGHTHRAGLAPATQGIYGRVERTLWGMEVGNLMDMRSPGAAYSKIHNWQQAFGLLYVDGRKVTPHLVTFNGRSFVFEGVQYKW